MNEKSKNNEILYPLRKVQSTKIFSHDILFKKRSFGDKKKINGRFMASIVDDS